MPRKKTAGPSYTAQLAKLEAVMNQMTNNATLTRAQLSTALGQQFGGDRDIYQACGFKKNLTFTDFNNKYCREGIAKRVVDAYPDATWRGAPVIIEDEDPMNETDFEKAVKSLIEDQLLYHYLARVDRLSGIYRYGALYIGFDDRAPKNQPVERANQVLYFQPLHEGSAQIAKWDTDQNSTRNGLPEQYNIAFRVGADDTSNATVPVDWSRVIHIPSDDPTESDVYGTPRLEPVFNYMYNVDKLSSASPEMFWRGAFLGFAFIKEKEARMSPETQDALEDKIKEFVHTFNRYINLEGLNIHEFRPEMADPTEHFDMQVSLISATTGIPKRILIGSERGELASSQDADNWDSAVDARRKDHAEPLILRPTLDRLIELGVLPEPRDGYTVKWPDIDALSEAKQAEIATKHAEAIAKYVSSGADALMAPEHFFRHVMHFEDGVVEAIMQTQREMLQQERDDFEADQRIREEAAEEERARMEAEARQREEV